MEQLQENKNPDVDFERICVLYANINIGYFGILIAVCFLYFVVYEYSSPWLANIWAPLVLVAYLPRITFSVLFSRKLKKNEITPGNIGPWEKYMTRTSIVPYMCFVSVIFFPYEDNELISILICALVFMSLATGGVLTLTTSLGSIMWYMNLAITSIIIKSVWLQDKIFILLAIFMFLGYMLVIKLIRRQYKMIVENITLKIENTRFSLTDPLTRLGNRRRLDLHVEKLVPASQRSGDPFSVIMLDIDHFKDFNDTYGHNAGDKLLVKIANILKECSRDQDLVVRYGGEEFIVLLPNTRIRDAETITRRILATVKDKTDVTISAGLAEYDNTTGFDRLVKKADEALYTAKENGRDQYILAAA